MNALGINAHPRPDGASTAILCARPEVGAIIHTHATYCTTLAIFRREVPAVQYVITTYGQR